MPVCIGLGDRQLINMSEGQNQGNGGKRAGRTEDFAPESSGMG